MLLTAVCAERWTSVHPDLCMAQSNFTRTQDDVDIPGRVAGGYGSTGGLRRCRWASFCPLALAILSAGSSHGVASANTESRTAVPTS